MGRPRDPAINITIIALERKVPVEPTLQALGGSATGFLTYLLAPWLAVLVFTSVAIVWLVPDRRVERDLAARESSSA